MQVTEPTSNAPQVGHAAKPSIGDMVDAVQKIVGNIRSNESPTQNNNQTPPSTSNTIDQSSPATTNITGDLNQPPVTTTTTTNQTPPADNNTNQNQETKKEESKTIGGQIHNFLLDIIPLPFAIVSSIGHLIATGYDLLSPSAKRRESADRYALGTSKWVLTANCILQTIEALKSNRIVEAFSRIIEPVFILAESKVEDLNLARGMGLGLSQFVLSQEGIFRELANRIGIKKGDITKGQDLDLNIAACKKIFKEILDGGIGNDRRFLTGFNGENIKTKFNEFLKKFNFSSFGELFNSAHGTAKDRFVAFIKASGLESIQKLFAGDKERDKGHTTALSGYFMVFGSLLGYIDKASRGSLYKIGGTIRNLGGVLADIGLFSHPDANENISSLFLSIATIMDIFQRFIPDRLSNLIKPWGNFSMAAYNIGVAIYLNRSNMRTNKEEETDEYDTDLDQSEATELKPEVELDHVPTISKADTKQVLHEPQQYATAA